jgi:hypothetical protein
MKVGVLAIMMAILLPLGATAGPVGDNDSDGTVNPLDMCSNVPHSNVPVPCGLDTDNDGYGNGCDGDLNNDSLVNGADFSSAGANNDFLDCFLSGADPAMRGCDHNCDTLINGADFSSAGPLNDFLDFFLSGQLGPSGLACAGTVPCP